jgi:YVTN family beta-propeller protein
VISDPRIGTEFSGYAIEQELGRGGMGVVYLAVDTRLGRKVALKLLSPELSADQRFRDRFINESRMAASLEHPCIVPVYEAGEHDGQLYIAMRYIPGRDLRGLLTEEGSLPMDRVVALLEQVADALDTAHDRGLIHRDIKPANIMIEGGSKRDRAYLTDFGVTKRVASRSDLTQTGQFMGTVDYVAPEQIEGQEVDRRADQYSLGCVAFECLTGRPPFAKDSEVATIYAHLRDSPPDATAVRPDVPQEVNGVLRRAMAKRPADRFDTCGAMSDAMRLVAGATISGPTLTGRRRRLIGMAAAALVVIAGVLTAVLVTSGGTNPRTPPSGGESSTPVGVVRGISRIDPITNRVVKTFDVRAGAVAIGDGDVVWAFLGNEVLKVNAATNTIVARIPIQPRDFGVIDITPAGLSVGEDAVWAAAAPSLVRIDPGRNEVAEELLPENACTTPSGCPGIKDPSGVATGFGAVWVLHPSAGIVEKLDPATNERLSTARVPNATAAAIGEGAVWVTNVIDDVVFRIDPETGKVVARIPVPGAANGIAVGNGSVWVTNSTDGTVVRIDPATNAGVATIAVGERPKGLAVGAGAVWVANSKDGTVSRIDPTTNRVTTTIPVGTCEEGGPAGVAVADDGVWVVNQCVAI